MRLLPAPEITMPSRQEFCLISFAITRFVHKILQLLTICLECFLSVRGQSADRERQFAFEHLFDLYIACFVQLGKMSRKISLGQTSLTLQEEEVRTGNRGQNGHDQQARRFMDEAIKGSDGSEFIAHFPAPFEAGFHPDNSSGSDHRRL